MNFDYKKVIKPEINVGEREQKIRLLTGTVLVFISIFTASIILLLVGLILIATGYFGRCPAYAGINYNTLDKNGADPVAPEATKSDDKAEPASKPKPAAKKPAKKAKASNIVASAQDAMPAPANDTVPIASAAAVASSSMEAFATGSAVRSATMVW